MRLRVDFYKVYKVAHAPFSQGSCSPGACCSQAVKLSQLLTWCMLLGLSLCWPPRRWMASSVAARPTISALLSTPSPWSSIFFSSRSRSARLM